MLTRGQTKYVKERDPIIRYPGRNDLARQQLSAGFWELCVRLLGVRFFSRRFTLIFPHWLPDKTFPFLGSSAYRTQALTGIKESPLGLPDASTKFPCNAVDTCTIPYLDQPQQFPSMQPAGNRWAVRL